VAKERGGKGEGRTILALVHLGYAVFYVRPLQLTKLSLLAYNYYYHYCSVYTVQLVVQLVVQPVVKCKHCSSDNSSCTLVVTTLSTAKV